MEQSILKAESVARFFNFMSEEKTENKGYSKLIEKKKKSVIYSKEKFLREIICAFLLSACLQHKTCFFKGFEVYFKNRTSKSCLIS